MIFDVLAILIVIEFIKVLAEDTHAMITGRANPRLERRRARQRSRRDNRIWGALVNYLGDVAEDAREQATEKRQARREQSPLAPLGAVAESEPALSTPRVPRRSPVVIDLDLDDPSTPQPAGQPDKTDPDPGPGPAPAPVPGSDEGTDARIIPLFPTTKEDAMTTSTGEATGLISAMNHAQALTKTYENYAATGDTFVASLANGEVSGEAVAAAERAREAEQLAAAQWAACHKALAEQLKVKEAYDATPGAGSKQFVTAE